MKKAFKNRSLKAFRLSLGRCERIRTFDPLHPMQVRYQAAPHTEIKSNYSLWLCKKSVGSTEQITDFKQLASDQLQALLRSVTVWQIRTINRPAVFKIRRVVEVADV